MPPTRVLLDTAVFVYAVGVEHPHRAPSRALVRALAEQRMVGEASVELVQEFLHQRARRTGDRLDAVRRAEQVAALCSLHDVTPDDLRLALRLFGEHGELHARDAIHAATALNRGIGVIVSPDPAFDGVLGLRRLPIEGAAAAV
jgi:predicted nucleic acid-binding protein